MKIEFNIWNVILLLAVIGLTIWATKARQNYEESLASALNDNKETIELIKQKDTIVSNLNDSVTALNDTIKKLKHSAIERKSKIKAIKKEKKDWGKNIGNMSPKESYEALQVILPPKKDSAKYMFSGNQVIQIHLDEMERFYMEEELVGYEKWVEDLDKIILNQALVIENKEAELLIRDGQLKTCTDQLGKNIEQLKKFDKKKDRQNWIKFGVAVAAFAFFLSV